MLDFLERDLPLNQGGRVRARRLSALRLLLVLAAAGVLTLAACQGEEDAWQRIQESGRLRVGLEPTFPPFETLEGEDLTGLDVDLARAIGDDHDLAVEFVYFGYDGLYDALLTGQVDALISALVVMPEKTRDFSYSLPYFDAGQFLVSPDKRPVTSMEQLQGKIIAVELGAQGHVLAVEWARRVPGLSI